MKTSFLFATLIFCNFLNAQSNLSIFNNNGQQFYVVLNGIRQNSKPETNVQVSQIKNGSYAVKVIFADGKTPDIDKNFMIDAPYDITTRIVFKKGKGKLQLMGMEPTHGVIQEAVVYRPTDAANYSDAIVLNTPSNPVQTTTIQTTPNPTSTTIQTPPVQNTTSIQTTGATNTTGINMNVNVVETPNTSVQTTNSTVSNTTTTTTTGTLPDENVNLNMNVSIAGVNLNLNANASGTGLGTGASVTETTSSSSTITTTTTSSSQVNANIQLNGNSQVVQNQQNQQNAQQQQVIAQVQQAPLSSRVNCTKTMNRLEAFKAELQDQSFEEDRLEALQLAMKNTCLTTAQAEQLLDLFTFDENRLEVAKYLSDRLTDRDNAAALAKKLTFDSNKMEYRRYISE
ncbi:MAG: DUF4476 domain-containing protein [Flavobacteriales bacterium]